jgi:hypothetical protein
MFDQEQYSYMTETFKEKFSFDTERRILSHSLKE